MQLIYALFAFAGVYLWKDRSLLVSCARVLCVLYSKSSNAGDGYSRAKLRYDGFLEFCARCIEIYNCYVFIHF